jgi:hypothetical protein
LDLAHGCDEVAQALLDGLQKYPSVEKEERRKAEEERKNQKSTATGEGEQGKRGLSLRSIRAALSLVWGSKKLNELQDRLNNYRDEVSLRLLVFLNANQQVQSQVLNQLKRGNQEIVEVLSFQCNTLRLKLDQDHERYTELVDSTEQEAERRHAETIAAILTNRDGNSTTIAPLESSSDNLFKNSVQTSQKFLARTFRGPQLQDSQPSDYEDNLASSSIDLTALTAHILRALEFREMGERQAKVAQAYDHTFEWIYDSPKGSKKPWSDFAEWLESGVGIYWINGKAGSGKSTLMKYISAHESTLTLLKQWGGSNQLFIGTFFFWYAGTSSLQRSQAGLFRSLLLCVLRHRRELVPVLFPNVIRALQSGQQALPLKLTETELQYAFSGLVQTDLLSAKVCFIIDGLDEYDGDHDELAGVFAQVTQSKQIKIVLSSRPIPACHYAFSKCPNLRLQDLTFEDIRYFADNELSQHPLMQRVEITSPGATDELVDKIVSKASGVFLWVSVVVKLLVRGLRDYDTVADLRRKLFDLPEELEQLYSHMLRSMPKANRTQGSKFLQLVHRSLKVQGRFPMTLLQLSFAEEEEEYEKGFGVEPYMLSVEEERWRLESIEGRLRSRCCGLVEAHDPPPGQEEELPCEVGFLHRTVVEFLEDKNNWKEVISWTSGSRFNCAKALLCSSVEELRAKLLPREARDEPIAFRAVARLLTFETTMEADEQELCRQKYIPELTRLLFSTWGENDKGRCSRLGLSTRETLLVTAAHNCSEAQLRPLLDACDGSSSPQTEPVSSAKVAAFLLSEYVGNKNAHARVPIARGIVACRPDPNEPISFSPSARQFWNYMYALGLNNARTSSWTLWEFLLHHLQELISADLTYLLDKCVLDTIIDLLISFLENRADRHVSITLIRKKYNRSLHSASLISYDATGLVELFCCRIWDLKKDQNLPLTALAQKLAKIETLFATEEHAQRKRSPGTTKPSRQGGSEIQGTGKNSKPNLKEKNALGSGYSSLPSRNSSTVWTKSPWKDYVPVNDPPSSPTKHILPALSAVAQNNQTVKRWTYTKPVDRLSLLDDADRELAIQLSRVNLSARNQRKVLLEMMNRTRDQQERLIQCAEALKAESAARNQTEWEDRSR